MANFGTERVYQNFEPATRWTSEPDAEVLVADLPGFKKEQLKVAVTATRKLRLTGERPTGGNKWIRFHQEIPIPQTADIDTVSAMFKDNKLYIRHPKLKTIIPETKLPSPVKTPVFMKPHDQHETKQGHGSKFEKPSGSKTDQLKHDAQQKAKEVQSGIKTSIGDAQHKAKEAQSGIKESIGHAQQKAKEVQSGIKESIGHAQHKAKEVQSGKKESIGEPKGPLGSKDDEKDKIGAKWFEKYKEATGNVVKEAKNKKQLLGNLAASVLLVLLILLYARNAVRSSLVWNSDE